MRTAFCLLALASWLPGQSVKITRGAADYQVFQRDDKGIAAIAVEGTVEPAAAVEVRLLRDGKTVARAEAKGEGGQWSATLAAVPTGGPYRLEARPKGGRSGAVADHLLVGDLWILAGQSNMEGVGNLEDLPPANPLVNSFDMRDRWVNAKDPLHQLVDAADRVHWRGGLQGKPVKLEGAELDKFLSNRRKGAGVGVPFASEMVQRTGVPIGLVPSAHGGTSMDQWSPELKDRGGDSLYGGMVRRFKATGGKVRGMLWYQGESDANPKAAPEFQQKFEQFVAAVRKDFEDPDLPFYYVQIGRHVAAAAPEPWNMVQDIQLKAERNLGRAALVTCVDCRLDDGIHVGTDDFPLLGRRLANVACKDLYPEKARCASFKRGPRPVGAQFSRGMVTVQFAEVNGKLVHEGRLTGFTILDKEGKAAPVIYRQRVSAARADAVELLIGGRLPEGAVLHYGWGRDPAVNLRDEAGMAAPVFGPMPIAQ